MKKILFIILLLFLSFSLIPQPVQAVPGICPSGGIVPCGRDCNVLPPPGEVDLIDESQDCTLCHFFVLLDRILNFIFLTLVPAIAVLMFVIGGIWFFFAGQNPQSLSKAKSIITAALFGLLIIFAAWLIINTFFVIIGVKDWTGFFDDPATPEIEGWFVIDCPIS